MGNAETESRSQQGLSPEDIADTQDFFKREFGIEPGLAEEDIDEINAAILPSLSDKVRKHTETLARAAQENAGKTVVGFGVATGAVATFGQLANAAQVPTAKPMTAPARLHATAFEEQLAKNLNAKSIKTSSHPKETNVQETSTATSTSATSQKPEIAIETLQRGGTLWDDAVRQAAASGVSVEKQLQADEKADDITSEAQAESLQPGFKDKVVLFNQSQGTSASEQNAAAEVVKAGDTQWEFAHDKGVPLNDVEVATPITDPTDLQIDSQLAIIDGNSAKVVNVTPGTTQWGEAVQARVYEDDVMQLQEITNPTDLQVNSVLIAKDVPAADPTTTSETQSSHTAPTTSDPTPQTTSGSTTHKTSVTTHTEPTPTSHHAADPKTSSPHTASPKPSAHHTDADPKTKIETLPPQAPHTAGHHSTVTKDPRPLHHGEKVKQPSKPHTTSHAVHTQPSAPKPETLVYKAPVEAPTVLVTHRIPDTIQNVIALKEANHASTQELPAGKIVLPANVVSQENKLPSADLNPASQIANYIMVKFNATPTAAAGMVGNFAYESGLNPERLQGSAFGSMTPYQALSAWEASGTNTGWGIAQFTPPDKLAAYAHATDQDPNSWMTQVNFVVSTMQVTPSTTHPGMSVWQAVQQAESPGEAAATFMMNYEKPSASAYGSLGARQGYASATYHFVTVGTPPNGVPTTPLPNSGAMPLPPEPSGSGTVTQQQPTSPNTSGNTAPENDGAPSAQVAAIVRQGIAWATTESSSYPQAEVAADDGYSNVTDCEAFIRTMFHGINPDLPEGTWYEEAYMRANPKIWQPVTNLGNTSNLVPGDVFVINANGADHTFMYTGQIGEAINGTNVISASLGGHPPEAFSISEIALANGQYSQNGAPFQIFRFVGAGDSAPTQAPITHASPTPTHAHNPHTTPQEPRRHHIVHQPAPPASPVSTPTPPKTTPTPPTTAPTSPTPPTTAPTQPTPPTTSSPEPSPTNPTPPPTTEPSSPTTTPNTPPTTSSTSPTTTNSSSTTTSPSPLVSTAQLLQHWAAQHQAQNGGQ